MSPPARKNSKANARRKSCGVGISPNPALAASSKHPVQAVKAFCDEIGQAVAGALVSHRATLRRLSGELFAAAAISMKRGSPRMSQLIAVNAVLSDPGYWFRPTRLFSLYREWNREPSSSIGHGAASVP